MRAVSVKRPHGSFVKLAQYYRVSTDYLLGLKDEP